MKRTITTMLFFLSFVLVTHAQTAIKSRGDKAYKMKDYTRAIQEYKALWESDKLKEDQLLKLANSYYYIRDYKNAAKKYMTYMREGDKLSLSEYNYYLQSLNMANFSDTAITDAIKSRLDLLPEVIVKRYLDLKKEEKKEKPFSKTITSYEFKNLEVNSEYSDFGVTIFKDSTVMFSSSREYKAYNSIYKKINQPFINIYKTKIKNDLEIDTVGVIKYVEKSMMHSASPYYDSTYGRLFYTQSEKNKKRLTFEESKNNFRIVYGFINDDKKIKETYFYPKSMNGYSYGQPYFDEATKRLYFVSDMPGGYGGTDIYYVEMNAEGVVSEPVNLGEKVNSFANEMFPSVVDDQLYFSSDLFIGMGGLDVYSSKIDGSGFEMAQLLKSPINSIGDDFYYQLIKDDNKDKRIGYLSSNRPGGKGDDDIYSFAITKTLKKVKISGKAKQKGDTSISLPNAKIKVYDASGKLVDTLSTDKNGMYDILLPINQDYLFKVNKEGYESTSGTIALKDINNTNPISKDFYLVKELIEDKYGNVKINLEPVYFNYDDASITPKAETQLKFAIDYLNKYPQDKFKLEAHTDARGSNRYNLKLSERRAQSVYNYLLTKGIAEDRIMSVKGYGETRLINECKNGVECSDEKHEQNRRTDFVIVK